MKPIELIIAEQREQIQQDIMSILDGMDEMYIDCLCDMIVERFKIIYDEGKLIDPIQ